MEMHECVRGRVSESVSRYLLARALKATLERRSRNWRFPLAFIVHVHCHAARKSLSITAVWTQRARSQVSTLITTSLG